MDANLLIGLRIGIIGLGVTFLALGFLLIVMRLLLKIFPAKTEASQPPVVSPIQSIEDHRLEELAVALAVGICLLEKDDGLAYRDPSLGKLLENHHSVFSSEGTYWHE
jgi:Na+-transporting methylmalonyl-CoA/oxaloacetate decarboxylase gamma subunit